MKLQHIRGARFLRLLILLAVGSCWLAPDDQAHGQVDDGTAVETRFERVEQLLERYVENGQIAGAVVVVAHRGDVVCTVASGMRNREAELEMTADTIFRIASMTKPITSVAVMMLCEEGKLELEAPVAEYLPEMAELQVVETDSDGPRRLVAADREITIHDLLTHTSGLTYGFMASEPVAQYYADADVSDGLVDTPWTLETNVQRLAETPLTNHPGAAWQYSLSTDVLGRVIEVVSGKSLDEFFQQRIFEPLGMTDTQFTLPESKVPRLAELYQPQEDAMLTPVGDQPQRVGMLRYSATYPYSATSDYHSGGAGLVSTANDYLRFLQMLLNGGELDGQRLLKAETVAEMTRNQIGELSIPFTNHGDKFGYGFGIHSPESTARHQASVGTYSWGGIFNTYFWVDPQEQLIGIVLTQLYPHNHLSLWPDFQETVYDALPAEPSTGNGQ